MNRMPQIRNNILAGLAQADAVRIKHPRPRKLARELRKQLKMCAVKIEREDRDGGVVVITWAK